MICYIIINIIFYIMIIGLDSNQVFKILFLFRRIKIFSPIDFQSNIYFDILNKIDLL